MPLSARTILVTGASRGIGLEFVKQILKLPAAPEVLIATCRNPASATNLQVIAQSNPSVKIVKLDVEKDEDIETAFQVCITSTPNTSQGEFLPELSTSTLNILQSYDLNDPSLPLSWTKSVEEEPSNGTGGNEMVKISPGSWVVAFFPGKKTKKYVGMVVSVDDSEANVKFTRQNGQYFTWPVVNDIGWMPFYSLTAIEAPTLDGRERMLFPDAVLNIII